MSCRRSAVAAKQHQHRGTEGGEREGGRLAAHRRRKLAIALFEARRPVPRSKLAVLSHGLVNSYAGKSTKTLTRDIHELEGRNLIHKSGNGYAASSDLILGLMPTRAPKP